MRPYPKYTSILKFLDATVGSLVCRIAGLSSLCRRHPGSIETPKAPERILVIRPGGIGDMVLLVPVMRVLNSMFPGAKLDLVCESRNAEVVKIAGINAELLVYDRNPFAFLSRLLSRRYDIAIDTEQFHHFSAFFAFLSKARIRIGFNINPGRNPIYTHCVNYAMDGSESGQFMALLSPLGISGAAPAAEKILAGFRVNLPPDKEKLLPSSGKYAVIHAGTSHMYKQWPAENFARLVLDLKSEMGISSVLTGDAADRKLGNDIAKAVSAHSTESPVVLSGLLTLAETTEVMRRAVLFAGTDSGLSHIALGLGIPRVVLFGPSDSRKWGFENNTNVIVRKALPCSPCFILGHHKPCTTRSCMSQITSGDALEACRKVLK